MTIPKTEPVLISISIIVNAPVSDVLSEDDVVDPVLEAYLDDVAERLRSRITILESEIGFEDQGVSYHYLLEENAKQCARCGRWTSDYEAPNFQDLLTRGRTVEGNLFCVECLDFFDRFEHSVGQTTPVTFE